MNKTDSGIVIISFPDKKKKYTYMEDMEKKQFLQENRMNFAKNFKVRDVSGRGKDQMQQLAKPESPQDLQLALFTLSRTKKSITKVKSCT